LILSVQRTASALASWSAAVTANAIAGAPYAAGHDVTDPELAGDRTMVFRGSLETNHRRAGGHAQCTNRRQIGNELVGKAVAKYSSFASG
jgi:hypothetical protein